MVTFHMPIQICKQKRVQKRLKEKSEKTCTTGENKVTVSCDG